MDRSTDHGATWSQPGAGLPSSWISALAASEQYPDFVFAAVSSHGVFLSADRGDTWAPYNLGLPDLRIRQLHVRPGQTERLYAVTAGAGTFWIEVSEPVPASATFHLLLAMAGAMVLARRRCRRFRG